MRSGSSQLTLHKQNSFHLFQLQVWVENPREEVTIEKALPLIESPYNSKLFCVLTEQIIFRAFIWAELSYHSNVANLLH